MIAVLLALGIVLLGLWAERRAGGSAGGGKGVTRAAERKRLLARRDKLFGDLVRLETDHRGGRGDRSRYVARREELIAALEHVYGALDTDDTSPEPADRAGLAA